MLREVSMGKREADDAQGFLEEMTVAEQP
jgi:hypothetical protein